MVLQERDHGVNRAAETQTYLQILSLPENGAGEESQEHGADTSTTTTTCWLEY
jgi:hypothetical protein